MIDFIDTYDLGIFNGKFFFELHVFENKLNDFVKFIDNINKKDSKS